MNFTRPSNVSIKNNSSKITCTFHSNRIIFLAVKIVSPTILQPDNGNMCSINSPHCLWKPPLDFKTFNNVLDTVPSVLGWETNILLKHWNCYKFAGFQNNFTNCWTTNTKQTYQTLIFNVGSQVSKASWLLTPLALLAYERWFHFFWWIAAIHNTVLQKCS